MTTGLVGGAHWPWVFGDVGWTPSSRVAHSKKGSPPDDSVCLADSGAIDGSSPVWVDAVDVLHGPIWGTERTLSLGSLTSAKLLQTWMC